VTVAELVAVLSTLNPAALVARGDCEYGTMLVLSVSLADENHRANLKFEVQGVVPDACVVLE
jgi:hypothetical protein